MVELFASSHFRMLKRFLTLILILIGFLSMACAQKNTDVFTIYLVRHSEKDISSDHHSDAPLTPCGEKRSESLSTFLSDINLEAVYSTNYTRTKNTALPTATSKGLEIIEYDSDKLTDFATFLLENKQDALVVGHSNTTAVLAGLLVGQELEEFDLDIYNRVYQVVIYTDGHQLNLFHTAFDCNE